MAFTWETRMIAAARCGGVCANPACNRYLFGPALDGEKFVAVLEGAHIVAESPNGPRHRVLYLGGYDDLDNCIPLCRPCHHVVDHHLNWNFYPEEMLRRWREDAELMAEQRRGTPINVPFFDPAKARKVRDEFSQKLGAILDLMFTRYEQCGSLHRDAIMQLHFGGRGFQPGIWSTESSARSEDFRVAYQQDRLVNLMSKISTHLHCRNWYMPSNFGLENHERFRPIMYGAHEQWAKNQDDIYENHLLMLLKEFRTMAHEFIAMVRGAYSGI